MTNSHKNTEGAKLFRELLKRNGITRDNAAAKMEYQKSTIDAICVGNRSVPAYKIDMLAEAFPRIAPEEIVKLKEAWRDNGQKVVTKSDDDVDRKEYSASTSTHIIVEIFKMRILEITIVTRTIVLVCFSLLAPAIETNADINGVWSEPWRKLEYIVFYLRHFHEIPDMSWWSNPEQSQSSIPYTFLHPFLSELRMFLQIISLMLVILLFVFVMTKPDLKDRYVSDGFKSSVMSMVKYFVVLIIVTIIYFNVDDITGPDICLTNIRSDIVDLVVLITEYCLIILVAKDLATGRL